MSKKRKHYPPLHPLRLKDGPEGVLRKAWEDYKEAHPLFDLLQGPTMKAKYVPAGCDYNINILTGDLCPFPYGRMTPRDHMVVTEFVQWLGSPVGISFLTVALREAGYKVLAKCETSTKGTITQCLP